MSSLADHVSLISGIDAILEAAVAVVLTIGVKSKLGRIPPLAWLFAAYFMNVALLSLTRVFWRANLDAALSIIVSLELFSNILLLAMLARAAQIADALALVIDHARYRATEYERARHDYTQVVTHRIANPLTVIKGAAQTLDSGTLDEETRHQLRLAIIEASERIEAISLAPEQAGEEEHELDAIPHLDNDSSRKIL